MTWLSVAKWPYPAVSLSNTENISTDTHATEREAYNVIAMLERDGFGGEGIIFPLKTYIKRE